MSRPESTHTPCLRWFRRLAAAAGRARPPTSIRVFRASSRRRPSTPAGGEAMFGPEGPDAATFFAEYWRRRPLLVRGGAPHFLGFRVDDAAFTSIVDAVSRRRPDDVKRGGDGVVFVQQADAGDPRLRRTARALAARHGLPDPWFDAVRTGSGSSGGIGSHYDDSDNFVLQQTGVKRWRLFAPDLTPEDELRRRMLKDPRVGDAFMPDTAAEYVLEPDDLLYIPLFWLHWGVSAGESVSVSLVCNAQSATRTLVPALAEVLSARRTWWGPLPRCHDLAERAAVFDELWAELTAPELRQAVRERWLASPGPSAAPTAAPRIAWPPVSDRVRALAAAAPPVPAPERLLASVVDADAWACVAEAGAVRALARSLAAARRAASVLDGEPESTALAALFAGADASTVSTIAARPELRVWTTRVLEALQFAYRPRVALLARYLPPMLLPALWRAGVLLDGLTLPVQAWSADGIDFPGAGVRLCALRPLPRRCTLELSGTRATLCAGAEVLACIDHHGASDSSRWTPLRGRLVPYRRDPASGLPWYPASRWLAHYLPDAPPELPDADDPWTSDDPVAASAPTVDPLCYTGLVAVHAAPPSIGAVRPRCGLALVPRGADGRELAAALRAEAARARLCAVDEVEPLTGVGTGEAGEAALADLVDRYAARWTGAPTGRPPTSAPLSPFGRACMAMLAEDPT